MVLGIRPPSVTVSAPEVAALHFRVSWQGEDVHTGVSHYDVAYKQGASGAWTGWLILRAVHLLTTESVSLRTKPEIASLNT